MSVNKLLSAIRCPLIVLCLLFLFTSSEVGGQDGQTPGGGGRGDGNPIIPVPGPEDGDTDEDAIYWFTLCCRLLPGTLEQAWHCYVKTEKFDGETGKLKEVLACRGGPTGLGEDLYPRVPDPDTGKPRNTIPGCPDWGLADGAWGPMETYCGPFKRGHPDFPKEGETHDCVFAHYAIGDSPGNQFQECLENTMKCIEQCCIRYEALGGQFPTPDGRNSNSAACAALTRCFPVFIPLPEDGPLLGAPGWCDPIEGACMDDCLSF